MLKLLAIILLGVLFLRSIAFLFRLLIGGSSSGKGSKFGATPRQRPSGSNLDVDHVPENQTQPRDFKGGEYVEYEDVK